MVINILIIQGHPDNSRPHLCHALADAYRKGAEAAGHRVRLLDVASLDFPLLRSAEDYNHGEAPPAIRDAQQMIAEADHLALIYPMWAGTLPALLKGFLEQTLRPGFAISAETERMPRRLLRGKSARVMVTMGMPALVYRLFFRAHGLKNLRRNVLKLCGVSPVRSTLVGGVDNFPTARAERCFARVAELGRRAR